MNRVNRGIILAVILCAGCGQATEIGQSNQDSPVQIDPSSATIKGIYDDPVTLTDGRFEGPPIEEDGASRPVVDLLDAHRVDHDLDGDGVEETAILLTENSGGSGQFLYIAILGERQGQAGNIATVLVGDRVQVEGFGAVGNDLVLDVVQAGPSDPLCCPTQKATRRWSLTDGTLTEKIEPA